MSKKIKSLGDTAAVSHDDESNVETHALKSNSNYLDRVPVAATSVDRAIDIVPIRKRACLNWGTQVWCEIFYFLGSVDWHHTQLATICSTFKRLMKVPSFQERLYSHVYVPSTVFIRYGDGEEKRSLLFLQRLFIRATLCIQKITFSTTPRNALLNQIGKSYPTKLTHIVINEMDTIDDSDDDEREDDVDEDEGNHRRRGTKRSDERCAKIAKKVSYCVPLFGELPALKVVYLSRQVFLDFLPFIMIGVRFNLYTDGNRIMTGEYAVDGEEEKQRRILINCSCSVTNPLLRSCARNLAGGKKCTGCSTFSLTFPYDWHPSDCWMTTEQNARRYCSDCFDLFRCIHCPPQDPTDYGSDNNET
jgi:hypothetical protein